MKGRQVTEILEVNQAVGRRRARRDRARPWAAAPTPGGGADGYLDRRGPSVDMQGVVKWYNQQKGFGFITPEDGSKDIFVHASTLARAGLDQLPDGTRVMVKVVQGAKGPEATEVSLA